MIKTFVTHEHCRRCRRCCRFTAEEVYFAPLFTSLELETLRRNYAGGLPEFLPKGDSANVFQLTLKRADASNPVFEYVCPFLDEAQYACTIYAYRPFDCQQWPFVVTKDASSATLRIVCARAHFCKGLAELPPEALAANTAEFIASVTSGDKARLLQTHPGLIWQLEPVHLADVVIVKEILPSDRES